MCGIVGYVGSKSVIDILTNGLSKLEYRTPSSSVWKTYTSGTYIQPTEAQGLFYFRATDNASLKEIYSEIDQMEKTKISVREYSKKQEEYKNWALLAFALLLAELLLRNTLLRNIP